MLYVCSDCFHDYALKSYIESLAERTVCDYCGREADIEIAAPIVDVAEHIYRCLLREYDDPINGAAWDNEDYDWIGITVQDADDLLAHDLAISENGAVLREIYRYIEDTYGQGQWCSNYFYGVPPEQMQFLDWKDFSHRVKHSTRYVFLRKRETRRILEELATTIQELDLIVEFNDLLFRARDHLKDEEPNTGKALGSPPLKYATQANRMSPPGIPMFYGSGDSTTALCEIRDKLAEDNTLATVATFSTRRPLRILDLANLPRTPSLFEVDYQEDRRRSLLFMHRFAHEIAKPIQKNGYQHIEYVPTQILTEYFRHIFVNNEEHLDGIFYSSSQRYRGISCVLFITNEQCCDATENTEDQCLLYLEDATGLDRKAIETELADCRKPYLITI